MSENSSPPPPPPPRAAGDHPSNPSSITRKVCVARGPIIVGAGPSGLAVAASLHRLSVPSVILERSDGIADLWSHRTYDRLSLHLPKEFCQLPHLPFPAHFPTYPSKAQFLHYLHSYAEHFSLRPEFSCTVVAAQFDNAVSLWRVTAIYDPPDHLTVRTSSPWQSSSDSFAESSPSGSEESGCSVEPEVVEYVSPWLVVATGENAEPVVPKLNGREEYKGSVLHSSEYKSGVKYKGKRVLVVGCGNSGMEMCLDLCAHGAMPFMSVRTGVHVLPREMLGTSTFGLAMKLQKWLPLRWVDRFLVMMAKMLIGGTEKYGLKRPKIGPLELKNTNGKTPVLDVGALSLIKNGRIKVVPEVESLTSNGAKFVDGGEMGYDTVILATGYRSNVPFWLKDCDYFSDDGKPKTPLSNGWRGENGLYCVGFTGKGLLGAGADAIKTALDIAERWRNHS